MRKRPYQPIERGDVERKGSVYSGWINKIVEEGIKAMKEYMDEIEREGVYEMPKGPERLIKAMKIYQKYWKRLLPLHVLLVGIIERARSRE